MASSVNKEIVDKIRKIMERTEGKGCTQGEAEAALKMASRLLAEHNLTMKDIELSSIDWTESRVMHTGRWPLEAQLAYAIVKRYFFVEGFFKHDPTGGKILMFFGKPENVEVAVFTYKSLLASFDDLWDFYSTVNRRPNTERRLYITGVSQGFTEKLAEERRAMEIERDILSGSTGGTSIVLASIARQTMEKFQEQHKGGKTHRGNFAQAKGDKSVLQAGYEAGKKLNLNKAIGERKGRSKGLPGA